MSFQLKNFPTKFSDIFSKTWVTYKKLFLFFVPLILLFNVFFAIGYFLLNEQSIWTIVYIDTTRFFIAKITDTFACFLIPFFLFQKLDTPLTMLNIFLKKYFLSFLMAVLPLFILKYILTGSFFFSLLSLVANFYFLFVFCFLITSQNNILSSFKQSFLLIKAHSKKILFFFLSIFFLTSIFRFILEFFIFFPEIQQALNVISIQNKTAVLQEILKIALTPKFYFFNNLIHLILQPFLSIFLAILFYGLCVHFSEALVTDFFQPFTTKYGRNTKTEN